MHGNIDKRKAKTTAFPRGKRAASGKVRAPAGVVRIPVDLDARLTELARKTGRSKTYYARKALETFIEDTEDYLLATASFASSKKTVSLDALRKKYKL